MKLSLSALIITASLSSVSANEANVDKYGRSLASQQPLSAIDVAPLKPQFSSSKNLLSTVQQMNTRTVDASSFIVGESYRPGQTRMGSAEFGDVDGDGDLELVTVSSYYFDEANDYSVFIFHPTGLDLGTPTIIKYDARANRNGLTLSDLDEDGRQEIIVGHRDGLTIIKSDGLGGFEKQIVNSSSADTLDAMDINLDGVVDLVGLPWSPPANQYIGDGAGNISTIISLNTDVSGYNDQAIGDMNNDGFDDLVVMSGQGTTPNMSIHYHDGIGELTSPESYYVADRENTGGIAVGDINGDGRDDVVLSRNRNSPTHLWVYTQNADGGLNGPEQLPSYDIPQTMRIADLNSDGFDDIIVLHGGWTTLGVYLNTAEGYGEEIRIDIPYSSHYDPEALSLGDLNGDGCPEMIAIADFNNGVIPITHDLCPVDNSITEESSGFILRNRVILFETMESGTIDMTLNFDDEGDLDLYLYDVNRQLLFQSNTADNPESISTDELPAGTYYAKIKSNILRWTPFELQITHY